MMGHLISIRRIPTKNDFGTVKSMCFGFRKATFYRGLMNTFPKPATNPKYIHFIPIRSLQTRNYSSPSNISRDSQTGSSIKRVAETPHTQAPIDTTSNIASKYSNHPLYSFKWFIDFSIIMLVFALSGSCTVRLVRPFINTVIGIEGSFFEGPWYFTLTYLCMTLPLHSAFLVTFGTILDTSATVMDWDTVKGFSAGAIAACGSVTFTNPWEVVKTRLQLQGELNSVVKPYKNAFHAFYRISHLEGINGIQRGLMPAYIYQILMNGTRLGFYDPIKDWYFKALVRITRKRKEDESKGIAFLSMILGGGTSGAIGGLISSPFFLIKTRMQSFSPETPNVGYQHANINQGIFKSLVAIYKTEGVRGLWRGVDAAMLRTSIGSAVQLSTYDTSKRLFLETGWFNPSESHDALADNRESGPLKGADSMSLHFASSLMTSLLVCLAMNPFDVASTRMYNQKSSKTGKSGALYKNAFDCLIKTIQNEGVSAIYKGLSAHYLRIGTTQIVN